MCAHQDNGNIGPRAHMPTCAAERRPRRFRRHRQRGDVDEDCPRFLQRRLDHAVPDLMVGTFVQRPGHGHQRADRRSHRRDADVAVLNHRPSGIRFRRAAHVARSTLCRFHRPARSSRAAEWATSPTRPVQLPARVFRTAAAGPGARRRWEMSPSIPRKRNPRANVRRRHIEPPRRLQSCRSSWPRRPGCPHHCP